MNTFELMPTDSRKSFYHKAIVTERGDGAAVLRSYETEVCMIDAAGNFRRLWSGESATTMRHVNSFLYYYGISGGGIAWWRQQPVEEFNWIAFYIGDPKNAA